MTVSVAMVLSLVVAVWAIKLVQVQRSVEQSRQYWSQPRGEPGGLLYVALGDSAAQGIGASRPDRGYVGLLAQQLRDTTRQPVQVVNLSRSGARIDDVLRDQVPQLRGMSADLVTVAVGGNDVREFTLSTFAGQAEALVAALPPGTLIADVPYFMHGRWQDDAEQAAGIIQREAQQRGLVVVPLHEALRREGWSAVDRSRPALRSVESRD